MCNNIIYSHYGKTLLIIVVHYPLLKDLNVLQFSFTHREKQTERERQAALCVRDERNMIS